MLETESQQIESIQVTSWCLTMLSSTIFGGKHQQQIKKSSMQNSQNSKIVDVIHWNLLHCFRSDSLAECPPHTQFAFNFASKDGGYQCQLLWYKWHNRTPPIKSQLTPNHHKSQVSKKNKYVMRVCVCVCVCVCVPITPQLMLTIMPPFPPQTHTHCLFIIPPRLGSSIL